MTIQEFVNKQRNGKRLTNIREIEGKLIFNYCKHECTENNWIPHGNRIECRRCSVNHSKMWHRNGNTTTSRSGKIKIRLIGVTPRNTKCELCDKCVEDISKDHKPGTNIFRGWLCRRCNNGVIGGIEANNISIQRIINYLARV